MSGVAARWALVPRVVLEEARERLATEAADVEERGRRVNATIAAVAGLSEQVCSLDYTGKRQAMIDLGVAVRVYPDSQSVFHWTMSAFEQVDGIKRLFLEGEYQVGAEQREALIQSLPSAAGGSTGAATARSAAGRRRRIGRARGWRGGPYPRPTRARRRGRRGTTRPSSASVNGGR